MIKKEYRIIEEYQVPIQTLFNSCLEIVNSKQLNTLLLENKKILKRSSIEDVWRLLRSPFYAASYVKHNQYYPLDYVEAFIDLDTFIAVQEILDRFEDDFIKALLHSREHALLIPECSICQEQMVLRKNALGKYAYYVCTKHRKVKIDTNEVNQTIKEKILNAIQCLPHEDIEKIIIASVQKTIKSIQIRQNAVEREIKQKQLEFVCSNVISIKERSRYHFGVIKELKSEVSKLKSQETNLENTKSILGKLVTIIKDQLTKQLKDEDLLLMIYFLVKELRVDESHIELKMYLTDFFRKGMSKDA
ncbi:hypothetical protein ACNQFZ_11370 [Schinkia sp. CFF1]